MNKMKFVALLLAMALYALTIVQASPLPTETDIKCKMNCDLQEYKPICATNDGGETKTFNNLCIMKTQNCVKNSTFQKISDDECP